MDVQGVYCNTAGAGTGEVSCGVGTGEAVGLATDGVPVRSGVDPVVQGGRVSLRQPEWDTRLETSQQEAS